VFQALLLLEFHLLRSRSPSQRMVTVGSKGMVATSQYLAANANLDMTKRGGHTIHADIASAACLTGVEPTTNGIGGDAFALVWYEGKLYGLNSCGYAPEGLSCEALERKGIKEIPKYGWVPVTVPGAVAAWRELSDRFGKLPFEQLLEP